MDCSIPDIQGKDESAGLNRNTFLRTSGLAALGLLTGCLNEKSSTDPISENAYTAKLLSSDQKDKTMIDLSSNTNPYGPAPEAVSAMKEQLFRDVSLSGINRYPDFMSINIRTSAAKLNRVSPLNIVPTCGISEAVNVLAASFLEEGSEMITTDPTFFLMEKMALAWGAYVTKVPLKSDHTTDLDAIFRKIGNRTRLIYLMNPHNPSGTIIRTDELINFMAGISSKNLLRPEKIIVVFDEAYGEYVIDPGYDKTLTGYISLNPLVVLRTQSFAYGMAGLRCGYAIARRDIAAEMDGSLLYYVNSALNSDAVAKITPGHKGWKHPEGNINRLAESGMIASLVSGQDHIRNVRTQNRNNLEKLYYELELSGINYIPSQANFVLIDLGIRNGKEIKEKLGLMNISVRSGDEFHPGYTNCIRVSVGTENQVAAFISALREVLQ
jgi:histidinol-phosphate aminotransferase